MNAFPRNFEGERIERLNVFGVRFNRNNCKGAKACISNI